MEAFHWLTELDLDLVIVYLFFKLSYFNKILCFMLRLF